MLSTRSGVGAGRVAGGAAGGLAAAIAAVTMSIWRSIEASLAVGVRELLVNERDPVIVSRWATATAVSVLAAAIRAVVRRGGVSGFRGVALRCLGGALVGVAGMFVLGGERGKVAFGVPP